jgi:hypothetical protein
MLNLAGRRLLVSPWFAAGAGFVIATGAIIYVPHTNLDFGNAIHVTHCKQASCKQPTLTPQGPAPGLPAGGGVTASPSAPSVPAGMTFWYESATSTRDGFSMWIQIRARQDPGPWKLSFLIQGGSRLYVYGAPAQPYGADGVTVSSVSAGTQSAGYAQIFGHQSGADGESSQVGYIVQFQVRGVGTPSAPSRCSYNGAPCTFRRSSDLAPAQWPGSE